MKKDCETGGLVVPEREEALGRRPAFGGKKRGAQPHLGGLDFVRQFLISRELADELQDSGNVGDGGGANGDHGRVDSKRQNPAKSIAQCRPTAQRSISASYPYHG